MSAEDHSMSAEEPPPEPAASPTAPADPGPVSAEGTSTSGEGPEPGTSPEPPSPPAPAEIGEPLPVSAERPDMSGDEAALETPPDLAPPPAAGDSELLPLTGEVPSMSAEAPEFETFPEVAPRAPTPADFGGFLPMNADDLGTSVEPETPHEPALLAPAPEPSPPVRAELEDATDVGGLAQMSAEGPGMVAEEPWPETPHELALRVPAPEPSPPTSVPRAGLEDAHADFGGPVRMSAEVPRMSDEAPQLETPPEPVPQAPAPAPRQATSAPPPPPQTSAPPAASTGGGRVFFVATLVVIALAAGGYFLARSGLLGGAPTQEAAMVAPYAPQQQLVSARERVLAHAQPDPSSPVVVMFGAGAALDVNGRVSRGIGNDWYRITWNGQTAFVRQPDAVVGGEAPPGITERPEPEEEEEEKPAGEEEKPDEAEIAEFPPLPPAGFSRSDVRWIREPSARDFARFYPHRALDQGRSGRVVLDCVITGRGGLDCSVAEENPSGWGFGDAAVNIARQARVEPTTRDGRSIAGEHLRLPLQFRAD